VVYYLERMPPNNLNFNSLTRKNRVELMKTQPVSSKGTLKRQFGNRNIYRLTKKKIHFSNNTKNYNENTRGKVYNLPLPVPENWNHSPEYVRNHSNTILQQLNHHNFNNIRANEQDLALSLSRLSGPMSTNYKKPYGKERFNVKRKWLTNENAVRNRARVNYGKKEAKMMANLSATYNTPLQMLNAVDRLPITQQMKSLFKQDIRSKFEI